MFCALELRAQMVRKGYTQKRLASELGLSPQEMSRRMKSGRFGTDEISRMVELLEIEEPASIFFAKEET